MTSLFIVCSSGHSGFCYQLFVDKDDKVQLPTTQQLLSLSLFQSDIKLVEVWYKMSRHSHQSRHHHCHCVCRIHSYQDCHNHLHYVNQCCPIRGPHADLKWPARVSLIFSNGCPCNTFMQFITFKNFSRCFWAYYCGPRLQSLCGQRCQKGWTALM